MAPRLPQDRSSAENAENDGAELVIYATMSDGDGEPIRIKHGRVKALLYACADALERHPSAR